MSGDKRFPKDDSGNPITRAMAAPEVSDNIILGHGTKYVDIFNLDDQAEQVYHGISIYNPSDRQVHIALTDEFGEDKCIVAPRQSFQCFDNQSFGAGFYDPKLDKDITRVRAKLDANDGTLASGTIDYSGSGNPTDGMTVVVNGKTYEFSSDQSAAPGRNKVDIGVSADASWTNFRNKVNAIEQAVTVTIDTGTDIVTITSNYGGTYGNSIAIADGGVPTGAVFSGATLGGGAGGVTPIIHIW